MVKCPRCGLRYNHVNIHLFLPRVSRRRKAAMFANEYMTTGDLNERLTGKRGKLSRSTASGPGRLETDGRRRQRGRVSERHRRKRTATVCSLMAAPIAVFA